jgi:hypothetical protein
VFNWDASKFGRSVSQAVGLSGGAILSSMLVSSISLSLLLRLNSGAPQFFLISLNSIRNRHCRAIAGQVATVLDMLITAVRQGELDEQSIRPTKRQRSERSEREQYEGGADHDHPPNCRTRSIDHSPRVFIPNSRQSRRRRPTSRGHADPTDRIAKRFCQRLALVVEVSLLGDVIEIEGIGIGLVREQPATAARWPAAFLETKIPISPSRCSLRDKPQNEMRCSCWEGELEKPLPAP